MEYGRLEELYMGSDTDIKLTGLTEAEAQERISKEGFNELPEGQERSIFKILFSVLKEPMFVLLMVCGALYLFLGDLEEAIMLLFFVFVVMGITVYQERKTEKALLALKDLSSPRALVIRDGITKRVPGREVVRGDIIILSEGDRVPADATVREDTNLSIDESLLTGESVPVRKAPFKDVPPKDLRPGGDDSPFVYSGTMVVAGRGIGEVIRTGSNTELGKIGRSLQKIEEEGTLLQREVTRLVKYLTLIGLSLCALVVVVYGLTRGDFLNGFLAGITLAMAMLPEEFPVVLTIFLALGAWRISKNHVLTRKVSAIETLGSAQVLCVDKTGTLTLNKMGVGVLSNGKDDIFVPASCQEEDIPEPFHNIIRYSMLASQADPFDPMERALLETGRRCLPGDDLARSHKRLIKEYPLTRDLLAMSRIWYRDGENNYLVAVKGAPEAVFNLCHIGPEKVELLDRKVQELAGKGYRVIGVARGMIDKGRVPNIMHDIHFEFVGLVGLVDPVRPGVKEAIEECYEAGIRVVMITGDYPATAQHVAREIGLKDPDTFITGPQIDSMSEIELENSMEEVSICARVIPEQKLRIVEAIKHNKRIVAMTGDGVNDSPALRSANIGIAMGGRGTDVARESSAIVLLDDNFSSIVSAVRLGRRIFDNLKKAMQFIIAVHIPIAGLSFFPVFFNTPLVLMPVHILFLELMIDPACSVVFEAEPEERDIMRRRPRKYGEPMLSFRSIGTSIVQGTLGLAITLGVYLAVYFSSGNGDNARALAFTSLVFVNIAIIISNRSLHLPIFKRFGMKNKVFIILTLSVMGFLGLVLYIPFIRDLFKFELLHPLDILVCIGAGILALIFFELLKIAGGRRSQVS